MSSVQPPVLNPPLGTPSKEWAEKTTSSLDPTSKNTTVQPISQSPGVTPGNELPGAFPNRGETSTGVTNITETIVDTAKQYLPTSVTNTIGNLLGTSGTDTNHDVRASEHDVYHHPSLPSQERRGALPHEHVGGVGALPGTSHARSVAVLPDEQAEWSQCDTFAGVDDDDGDDDDDDKPQDATGLGQTATQKATNLGVSAGVIKADVPPKPKSEDVGKGYPETLTSREIANAQQAVGNIKPVAFDIKQDRDVSMPSSETRGQQPGERTGGVGSLPGSKDEQGVAVLPEERNTDKPKDTGATRVGVTGGADPLKKETQSRELPTQPDTTGDVQRPAGSEGNTEGSPKATLKERISGGMKVVSGKIGHDKSKVEEGKKLMHGQGA